MRPAGGATQAPPRPAVRRWSAPPRRGGRTTRSPASSGCSSSPPIGPRGVEVTFDDGTEVRTVSFDALATEHALPLLGLRPDRSTWLDLTLTDEDGRATVLDDALEIVTEPLPHPFPELEVLTADIDRMEPGWTLLTAEAAVRAFAVIVDPHGEVVWYYEPDRPFGHVALHADGSLVGIHDNELVRTTLLGGSEERILAHEALGVAFGEVGQFHHDVRPRPGGGYFALITDPRPVPAYPHTYTACDDLGPSDILDHLAVELDASGVAVRSWSMADLLDPTRVGFDSLLEVRRGHDWAHVNAIVHDEADDTLIVSLRNQDAVVKLRRETGELVWILGNHDNWPPELQPYLLEPVGEPFDWFFHQHAPTPTTDGGLLLFDNGNHRQTPCGGQTYTERLGTVSRGATYVIDEAAMTVRQTWEWLTTPSGRLYSDAKGDADELPRTGNVLLVYAMLEGENNGGNESVGRGTYSSRLFEVNEAGETIWDLNVYSDRDDAPAGWHVYRAERLPTLYPAGATEVWDSRR